MKNEDFIKIYRNLIDWEWWNDHNTTRLYLYCLIKAAWKDSKWRGIEIKRGQFVTSLSSLSKKTGLSVQQVKTALNHLASTKNITSKSYPNFRIITVLGYDSYQQTNKQSNKRATKRQQSSNKAPTTVEEYKEEKERKEGEEEGARARASTPPSPAPDDDFFFVGPYKNVKLRSGQFESLRLEFPGRAERTIERLSQYMAENGKTYQNHYAVLRRWAKEDEERDKTKAKQEAAKRTYDPDGWPDFDFEKEMEALKHRDV